MKTTLDIHDELMVRAKRRARQTGRPLRAIVEEGLRLALAQPVGGESYTLADCSIGNPQAADPLEAMSWQDLRRDIYGESAPA
jgi:hypothetical protein